MKTFKRLFNIRYNQKIFTIFLEDTGRKTFLELKEGKYIYPTLEDFTYLNKIYNEISYVDYVPTFHFDEKIRVGAATLALVSLLGLGGCTKIRVEVTKDEVILKEAIEENSQEEQTTPEKEENEETQTEKIELLEEQVETPDDTPRTIRIKDLEELNEVLGYEKVTEEAVRSLIDTRPLPDKVKTAAHQALTSMLEKVPTIDLRIFYQNIKDLTYEEIPKEELQETQRVDALFDCVERKITTHPEVSMKTLHHEMNHAFYSFYEKRQNTTYIRHEDLGTSLIEAMTEGETVEEIKNGTYQEERYILNILRTLTDFTQSDYHQKGIGRLIRKLQDEYKEVDVEYLVYSLDARKTTRLNKDTIDLLEPPTEIMDELFKMCMLKVAKEKENAYTYFAPFAEAAKNLLGEEKMYAYLSSYTTYLEKIGYQNVISEKTIEETAKKWKEIENILVVKGHPPIPVKDLDRDYEKNQITFHYTTLDQKGEEKKESITLENYKNYTLLYPEITWEQILRHIDHLPEENAYQKLIQEEKMVSPHLYQEIPIKVGQNLIGKEYVGDLELCLGFTTENELGFLLLKDNKIIYMTNPNLVQTTNKIDLKQYLPHEMKNVEELNLEEYLTEEYLKKKEGTYSHLFPNIKLQEDKYQIIPDYKVYLTDLEEMEDAPVDIRRCYLRLGSIPMINPLGAPIYDAILSFGITTIDTLLVDEVLAERNAIQLEEILEYLNLLDPNCLEYYFTKEEYENLFLTYLYETPIYQEENRHIR